MNPEQMLDMSAYEFDVACRNPKHPADGKPATVVVWAPCNAAHGFLCTVCADQFVNIASYAPCTCGSLHQRIQFRFPLIGKTA